MATNQPSSYDINKRKWIHRFNKKGIEGIISKIHAHKSIRIGTEMEKKIVEIATKDPRKDYGLPFSTWSLRVLAGYVFKELNLVNSMSYRNKKHPPPQVWDKVQTLKDYVGC